MVIRLIREWKGYRTGAVLKMSDGAANVLIRRQIAELIGPQEPGGERPGATSRPLTSKPKKRSPRR